MNKVKLNFIKNSIHFGDKVMIKYISGDILKAFKNNEIDILVHGCNCFCTMGAGIAKQIKKNFPNVYKIDLQTKKGDRNKLGTFSSYKINDSKLIINAYTQFTFWNKNDMLSYDAIKIVFQNIYENKDFENLKIGLPKIGCGLAGGNWTIISNIINSIFHDREIFVYEYIQN